MFSLVGVIIKLVNLNKESWSSPGLLVVLAENNLEIIQISLGVFDR